MSVQNFHEFERDLQKGLNTALRNHGLPEGSVRIRVTETNPDPWETISVLDPLPVTARYASLRRFDRLQELEDLNVKRLTKIRRLREGIRSYQRCHERDLLALRAARSRINELEGEVKALEELING